MSIAGNTLGAIALDPYRTFLGGLTGGQGRKLLVSLSQRSMVY